MCRKPKEMQSGVKDKGKPLPGRQPKSLRVCGLGLVWCDLLCATDKAVHWLPGMHGLQMQDFQAKQHL
jgi:hypothetical protein